MSTTPFADALKEHGRVIGIVRDPFESVVIHWRFRPTGDEGEIATIQGRQAAQDYIDAVSKEGPGSDYDWWLVAV